MTTESDRPPRYVNGKSNPLYVKWYRAKNHSKKQDYAKRYYLLHKKKSSMPCECGCGKKVDCEGARFIRGHCMRLDSIKEKHKGKIDTTIHSPHYKGRMSETLLKKRENHQCALVWRIKSPDNQIYTFRNLMLFVRENGHLFDPNDAVAKLGQRCCNAVSGICSISPRAKRPKGSWKGWRIDSQQERLFHEGKTLLEDITPPVSSNTTRETPPQ